MGTGGFRYGAGRHGWRRKCGQCFALDARRLKAHDLLRPGLWFSWQWTWDGQPSGSAGITMLADSMRVDYQWTLHGEPRNLCTVVALVRTPCRFGGLRAWFLCPDCQRRCLIVYGVDRFGYFSCRRCMNLAYPSEAEDRTGRLWRKTRKLEARLGKHGVRPKGMHRSTYDRICDTLDAIEEEKDREFTIAVAGLLRRTGMTLDDILR